MKGKLQIQKFEKTREEKKRITFSEWLKQVEGKEGIYHIERIFKPNRFPSFSFVFRDFLNNEWVDVVKSVKSDIWKALRKAGFDALIHDLFIVVNAEGVFFEWSEGEGYSEYQWGYRANRSKKASPEDEIEL